ncbi:AIPR family protein [Mesorhizobium sp. BH1-1-5]|uniref:AIPR family protein n=1 Tax=Mesorhizobium sp. BH1-1-5 TaxID=2876661 RepID=UPI001CCEBF67|nr:AIPR family protein [Mesorhizobium sp. BH1-1-5]MBZ9991399.1 AIPR family protein [Mesorhizobium sp. BH1-1-5]
MSDGALAEFHQDLIAEVEEGLSTEEPFSANVFTRLILERLEEAGQFDGAIPLYQEGPIRNTTYRIDGYSYDEERARLDLFTTLYFGDIPASKIPSADTNRALERALRFAGACVGGLASLLEPSNTDASDLARLIEDKAQNLSAIRVVLLTDGIVGNIISQTVWREKLVEFEAYDIVRLFRVLGEGETRADISVDFTALTGMGLTCLHVPAQNDEYDAYLAVLPGEVLSQIYDRYGVRLLELNVRAFLGLQGRKSVNAELRRTIADQPSMFLAFNNGIVATVDELDVAKNSAGLEIRSLKGLQIVNGGQTTASLHRARRKDSLSLEHVAVPVKIIKVGGADLSEMVSSISRAANRQNAVQLADFSANDPFHQQIETLANTTWLDDGKGRWFYERARGSYLAAEHKAAYKVSETKVFRQQTPKQRRLSKLDVARYLSAWESLPDKVCLGGQKNFQMFMQRLKDAPIPPPDQTWFKRLIAIAVLYRAAEKKIKSMKFPAYGSQITAYVVAGIAHRSGGRVDFDRLWSKQAISPEFEQLIADWAPKLDAVMRESAGQRNPSEWYKKADCWNEIQEKLPEMSDPLPPELSYMTADGSTGTGGSMVPKGRHTVADYDRIARCMEIPAAVWLAVAEHGQQTKTIHWTVAGICRTIASYAAGGWQRKPTAKQAKPALEAVIAVERAGLVNAGLLTEEAEADQA